MPELIAPTARLHCAWLAAHHEWGPGPHEDGFGLGPSDEAESPEGFAAWVARLAEESAPEAVEAGRGCLYRWIVEGDRVHGGIALRYGLNDYVRQFGHIGYGIRPTSRRRGLASWALGRGLDEARALGLGRVLIVCEADNLASARTIERRGGVLEGALEGVLDGVLEGARDAENGPVRRYWITVR
ncbi:GNAT family N-acetyltransferase [Kitasatospora sp. NPDC008050]|uniref:GNAT family N-acetyltransferase n=1 Tax=Kitasatospora sp. NPDC008050 TaxID=3364021 RepID=UPI0036E57608